MTDSTVSEEAMDTTTAKSIGDFQVNSYEICQVIQAHKSDVKMMAVTETGTLITGGRDDTVHWWGKRGGQFTNMMSFVQPKTLVVNSVVYAELEEGWRLFVGRKDGTIAVYASGSQEPVQIFNEHANNVSCLHVNAKNTHMLSGSWDTNVIIWPIAELNKGSFTALKCTGHTMSVWALASFPNLPDIYLTGGADKEIRMWKLDETTAIFRGHTDVVRALTVLSDTHFLSAGNDGTIIHWEVKSKSPLGKFATQAHDYIYSMTMSDSHILTTGEDGTLEFWSIDGDKEDRKMTVTSESVLETPASTTWDVKILPNLDIAVAGSDGRVYIYTNDSSRLVGQDIREALDAEIVAKVSARMARAVKEASDVVTIKVDVDGRPTQLSLNYRKGTDPGLAAQDFIQENQLPLHYLAEIIQYIKDNIPEARAYDVKSGKKVRVDGEEYDYALSVSLGAGEDMQMPFNITESPEMAAQRFVERRGLPVSTIPALAGMISQEMDKISRGSAASASGFHDPLTGGGRYVPGGSAAAAPGAADPFTGEGRYVPGGTGASSGSSGGFGADPLTGDGGYRPSEASGRHAVPLSSIPQDKKRPRGPLVPVPEYIIMGLTGKGEKALARLKEFNEKQDAFQLNPDQLNSLEELLLIPIGSSYSSELVQSALELAIQWSVEFLTPVLDFLRIALLHESVNTFFCSKTRGSDLIGRIIAILISDPDDVPLKVLVCRCIANAFAHPAGRLLFSSSELPTLAPLVVRQMSSEKSVLQVSAATALANWSRALLKQSEEVEQLGPKEDLLRAILTGIETVNSFGHLSEEAITRLLQAIVTVMWGDAAVIRVAKNRNMAQIAARLKDAVPNETGKNIARDIVEMTYAV